MSKRKNQIQRRIDQLTREKYELLSKIEELLKERDNEPGGQEKSEGYVGPMRRPEVN